VLSVLLILLVTAAYSLYGHVGRTGYDFIPYYLKLKHGTNGDGQLTTLPGLEKIRFGDTFLEWTLHLNTGELGWSGDYIDDWDRSKWTTVAVVHEKSSQPAILAANYSKGHIVYVTNQLAPQCNLTYNIMAWYFSAHTTPVRVALMTDSSDPPEQNLDDWYSCFGEFGRLNGNGKAMIELSWVNIRQYELTTEILQRFDVLVLAVGWSDGYRSWGRHWGSPDKDNAIKHFIANGGLLVLPEAGLYDEYGIPFGREVDPLILPFRTLQAVLSDQRNSFAMATLSISGMGLGYTLRGRYARLDRDYSLIAFFLFLATFVWVAVPMAAGLLLLQTWLVLAGVSFLGLALYFILRAVL